MQLAPTILSLSGRLLLALGLVCLLLGGYLGWQTLAFSSGAVSTTGEVVSYHEVKDEGATSFRPRVRFKSYNGDIITFTGQMAYTSERYAVGTQVPVMYREEKPVEARIARFVENWLGASIAVTVGTLCFIGGIFLRRATRAALAAPARKE
jgi:hypothetical protein